MTCSSDPDILKSYKTDGYCINSNCPGIMKTEKVRECSVKYSVLLTVLIMIALAIVIGSGFDTRGDVVLGGFSEAADGGAITVEVDVASPMGYVRSADEVQTGDGLYVKFYSAFGGYNGSLGARDSFELTIPEDCREIYFYRDGQAGGEYDLVLRRDNASSDWERVQP